jgi:hypothetical protein
MMPGFSNGSMSSQWNPFQANTTGASWGGAEVVSSAVSLLQLLKSVLTAAPVCPRARMSLKTTKQFKKKDKSRYVGFVVAADVVVVVVVVVVVEETSFESLKHTLTL